MEWGGGCEEIGSQAGNVKVLFLLLFFEADFGGKL